MDDCPSEAVRIMCIKSEASFLRSVDIANSVLAAVHCSGSIDLPPQKILTASFRRARRSDVDSPGETA